MILFENNLSDTEVAKICSEYVILNWTLNNDGAVDVSGYVHLFTRGLTKLPLNFGRVDGSFDCQENKLTSLEGCPNYVGGGFSFTNNNLTSLIGCPQYVGGDFYCRRNNIRSFEGIGHIGRGFYCDGNPIECLWYLFCDTSKIDTFNEWGVIQNNRIILYRLNDFLAEIGKEDVTDEQLNIIKFYYDVI